MKGKKCIGFLILFALVVLSSLTSSDASALKYAYNAFPLYQSNFPTYSTSNPTFNVYWDGDVSSVLDQDLFDTDKSYQYLHSIQNNICTESNYPVSIFASNYVNGRDYTSLYSGEGTQFRRSFDIPNPACDANVTKYSYDSIYGAKFNMTTGDAEQLVDFDNLFFDNTNPSTSNSIKRIDVPLNLDPSITNDANKSITFNFGMVQTSANNFDYLASSLNYELDIWYEKPTSGFVHDTITSGCNYDTNYTFTTRSTDLYETFRGFNLTCSYTPTYDMKNISVQLAVYAGDPINPSPFLTYREGFGGVYLSASYVITNNDNTWSGQYANREPSGEKLVEAPGYHQLYGYEEQQGCYEGDFLCQLSNLFNFSMINPFAPIFGLFTDQNQCAQIPTIAGMIHSEETHVCPWFNSTTRNIVTPVLGLASMMLIFGFTVRWLGARSGNLFEDSMETDHFSFSNKYGRKK